MAEPGYTVFGKTSKAKSLSKYNDVIASFEGRPNSYRSYASIFDDVIDNVDVRTEFGRHDYSSFRPSAQMPTKFNDIIRSCRKIYMYVDVVRNVIDLMTDFAAEDLKIIHTDPAAQAKINFWLDHIDINGLVNEFIKHFLVDGNVVVKRTTAKITKPVERQVMPTKVKAEPDIKVKKEADSQHANEIPWRYTFLNILTLDWNVNDFSYVTGDRQLMFKPNKRALTKLKQVAKNREILNKLPNDLKKIINDNNTSSIPLDMKKLYIGHHKKDSWDNWAMPFLVSVLPSIHFKDKLRLADLAALDGVINVIRLWRLGDHKEGFLPDQSAVTRLSEILQGNSGGGAVDIIWDSLLDMQQFYPPINEILGSEKYEQVNRDILIGLGVPEVLIGGSGGRFSNSWVQLKTLVEKLEYVRNQVVTWLKEELKIFCKGMGIKDVPKIRFSQMNLQDENITRRLILNLWDRGIISTEAVHEVYGEDFDIELSRLDNEKEAFKEKGLETFSPLNRQPSGSPPGDNGRPPAQQDDNPRDERTPKPRTSAELVLYALDAIDAIDKHVIPYYMKSIGVSNARQLTSGQKEEVDQVRKICLSCINYNDGLDANSLCDIASDTSKVDSELIKHIDAGLKNYTHHSGQEPSAAQKKRLQALIWANYKGQTNG